jgi:hypothetical protein
MVAAYFGEVNGVSTALYIYTACGAGISSTGGAKLQRERRGRKCSTLLATSTSTDVVHLLGGVAMTMTPIWLLFAIT